MKKLMFCGVLGLLLLLPAGCVYYDDDYDHHHRPGSRPSGHWERGYHHPQGTPPSPPPQYRDRGF